MDLRRFLLFINPFMGIVLLILAVILLFSSSAIVEGILLLLVGILAILLPRRVLDRHEETLRRAVEILDPEGNPTEEVCDRIKRIAELHEEEMKRGNQAREELKNTILEMEAEWKREKSKATDELVATKRQTERLAGWLESTPGALVRVDSGGIIRWANPGGEELIPDCVGKQANRLLIDWKHGKSGEFTLKSKSTEYRVMVESSNPEVTQGESSFLLIRDLSSEYALSAAKLATERARDQLRNVIASIVPQTTPEDTLREIAPLIFKVVKGEELTLALPGDRETGMILTWSTTRTGSVQEKEVGASTSMFKDLLEAGEEKIILDLRALRGSKEVDELISGGTVAIGLFPLMDNTKVLAGVRVGFRTEEDLSPGTVALLHQLLPAFARAIKGSLRFRETKLNLQQWQWYLDHLPDPVFLCNPEGKIRYLNRMAESMASELASKEGNLSQIVSGADRVGFLAQLDIGYKKGRFRFEIPLSSSMEGQSGELSMIRVDLGEEGLLLCVLRDISKRKAEAAEVHRREEEVGELYQLALDLGRSLDLQWVMEQIFTKALEVTKLDFGWATLIERETGSRDLASCYQIDLEVVRELYDDQGNASFEDRVLRTKKPVVLESMTEDPTISPDVVQRSGIRSLISVPLLLDGEVVGVLNLASSSSYQFKVQDIENLSIFGRIFARGVSNSKRYYETRRRAENFKIMISEQHTKLKALSEDVGALQDRMDTYRELLEALWGVGGAFETFVGLVSHSESSGVGFKASDWALAVAVGRALTQYLKDSRTKPSPTDLERFSYALKEDDCKTSSHAENVAWENEWEIRDLLPKVFMVPGEVRESVRNLLAGFRPLATQPYNIVVKPSPAGAVIEITIHSRDHFGATQELQAMMTTLNRANLPAGRPFLALILLHLVNGTFQFHGARIQAMRGEGEQIILTLEFPECLQEEEETRGG